MEVKVNSNFKKALRDIGNVPRKYVQKAMVTALNKVGAEVFTQAKRELRDATVLKAGVVAKGLKKIRHEEVMKNAQYSSSHATRM